MTAKIKTPLTTYLEVDIDLVYPNDNQPRKTFNNLDRLSNSISIHGQLDPIDVVETDKGYMIVDGERRYKSLIIKKIKTIKINLVDLDEAQIDEISLVKARQRDDLTPFEYAMKIGQMWNTGRYSKKGHLARSIGESERFLSKCFTSLKLDQSIITLIEADRLEVPLSVLEEIGRIKDTDLQCEIYDKYIDKEITRDDIPNYKRNLPAGKKNNTQVNDIKSQEHNSQSNDNFEFLNKSDVDDSIYLRNESTGELKIVEEQNRETSLPLNNKNFILEISDNNGVIYQTDTITAPTYGQALLASYKKYPKDAEDDSLEFNVFEDKEDIADDVDIKITKDEILNKTFIQVGTGLIVAADDINEIGKLLNQISNLKEENEQLKKALEEAKKNSKSFKSFKDQDEEKKQIKEETSFEEKNIKHMEISESVYIEYTDNDSDTVSYTKAKQVIKELQTLEFTYVCTGTEKSHNFLNSIPKYGTDGNKISLKQKYRK